MIRAFILILTLACSALCDEPQPAIRSAEEAVLRFRETRDSLLKPALSDRIFNALVPGIGGAAYLNVQPMRPEDYQPPRRNRLVTDKAELQIYGSFAAVAETKHPTWRLNYGAASLPGVAIYLDGVTGNILYIHDIPEG